MTMHFRAFGVLSKGSFNEIAQGEHFGSPLRGVFSGLLCCFGRVLLRGCAAASEGCFYEVALLLVVVSLVYGTMQRGSIVIPAKAGIWWRLLRCFGRVLLRGCAAFDDSIDGLRHNATRIHCHPGEGRDLVEVAALFRKGAFARLHQSFDEVQ